MKRAAPFSRELILRELADGAGPCVAPWKRICSVRWRGEPLSVPVILINGEYETVCELERSACFTFDYYGMGQRLGRKF